MLDYQSIYRTGESLWKIATLVWLYPASARGWLTIKGWFLNLGWSEERDSWETAILSTDSSTSLAKKNMISDVGLVPTQFLAVKPDMKPHVRVLIKFDVRCLLEGSGAFVLATQNCHFFWLVTSSWLNSEYKMILTPKNTACEVGSLISSYMLRSAREVAIPRFIQGFAV